MESARERTERSCDPQRNSRDLDTNMAEAPLKRPGASKAERMWRSKHWNQRRPVSAQDNRDEETVSPQLIAELQKYAEEIENQAEQQGVDQRRLSTESKQKPNVPPNKLPSPHGNDPSHNSDSDDMDLACKEESEFVYDTYVSFHTSSLATSGSGREVPNGNFGFIVIEEEDQPIWEAFMCEEEAAKEWNTDDEDENGRPVAHPPRARLRLLTVSQLKTTMEPTTPKTSWPLAMSVTWRRTSTVCALRTRKSSTRIRLPGAMKRLIYDIHGSATHGRTLGGMPSLATLKLTRKRRCSSRTVSMCRLLQQDRTRCATMHQPLAKRGDPHLYSRYLGICLYGAHHP